MTRILGPSKAKDLIFTARTLTATEALEWGISVSPLKFHSVHNRLFKGLVNYVSTPGTTAFNRSLELAISIAKNGLGFVLFITFTSTLIRCVFSSVGPSSCEASNLEIGRSSTRNG